MDERLHQVVIRAQLVAEDVALVEERRRRSSRSWRATTIPWGWTT
jgi:hypothetical protein